MKLDNDHAALLAENRLSVAVSSVLPKTTQDVAVAFPDLVETLTPIIPKLYPLTDDIEAVDSSSADPVTLDAACMDEIKIWGTKINGSLARTVEAIVEVGRLLLEAKAALPHGSYLTMVKKELRFQVRQAQNFTRIAKSPVLANAHNCAYLPRSVLQLAMLAKLRDDDLQEIIADVQARLAQGEDLNTDSPQLWAGYRAKYAPQAVTKQAPETLQVALSADPGQELLPAQGSHFGLSEEAGGVMGEAEVGQSGVDVVAKAESMPDAEPVVDSSPEVALPETPEPELGAAKEETEVMDKTTVGLREELSTALHTALPQAANDNGSVVALSPNLRASLDLYKSRPMDRESSAPDDEAQTITTVAANPKETLDPNSLTLDEQDLGNKLFELWNDKMAPEWPNYPIQVRLIMLQWLRDEAVAEANEKRQAA